MAHKSTRFGVGRGEPREWGPWGGGCSAHGERGTWIEAEGMPERRGRVLCEDGAVRVVRLGMVADTFFSIPARLGRVRGFVGSREAEDGSGCVFYFKAFRGEGC